MTETDDFDYAPFIVPLDQGAPNPYDDPATKQDDVTPERQVDGLGGGATFPESPLSVNEALTRLHDLVTSHATHMWSGLPIKGYCLAVQHEASGIGALHATAWQDWQDNPDQHPCTYETVDWTQVPRGAWVYNSSGQGGSGAGHIYRFCGIHNGKPLFCSNDVIPGQMAYLDDPTWFRVHWGQEMVGWSRVCNDVWQKGISGNDQGGQGGSGNGGGNHTKWPVWQEATAALLKARGAAVDAQAAIAKAQTAVDKITQHWDKADELKAAMTTAEDAIGALVPLMRHSWAEGHSVNNPPKKK